MAVDPSILCHCGSGLRAVRCCLVEPSAMVTAASAVHLAPTIERARQAFKLGNLGIAEDLSMAVLDLSPYDQDGLYMLSQIRLAQGNRGAAKALLTRLVNVNPNVGAHLTQLARLHLESREMKDAERIARMAIRAEPVSVDAHYVLAMVLSEAGDLSAGEACYRRAIAMLEKPDPIMYANLGWNLVGQGRYVEAVGLYGQSLQEAPDVPQTIIGQALLERNAGHPAAAAEILAKARDTTPNDRFAALQYAGVLKDLGRPEAAWDILDVPLNEGMVRGFSEWKERGQVLHALGRYEEAFAAWQEGSAAPDAPIGIGPIGLAHQVGRIQNFFTASRIGLISPEVRDASVNPQPIFIIGAQSDAVLSFGRWLAAGLNASTAPLGQMLSNLIEQIPVLLSSPHAYPEALADLWMADKVPMLETMKAAIQTRLRQCQVQETTANWVVNINPLDETQLGLAALLFPYAPIIHLIDHPLSTTIQKFASAIPAGLEYDGSILGAAEYVKAMEGIVEHMRSNFVLRYLPVRISDARQNPERAAERIFGFIDGTLSTSADGLLSALPLMEYHPYTAQLAPAFKALEELTAQLGFDVPDISSEAEIAHV